MLELLSRYWWAFVSRGIFAIIFGLLAWIWPHHAAGHRHLLWGIRVRGRDFAGINALGGWRKEQYHWLLLLEGLVGVGIGIITFINPAVTAIALLFYIAVWSIATGVFEICPLYNSVKRSGARDGWSCRESPRSCSVCS